MLSSVSRGLGSFFAATAITAACLRDKFCIESAQAP
jgi:hypothetical protein